MQKKLYFLDEQEKNRILNLHESRTENQYLLTEAIDRTTFIKKVDDICKAGTYGTGTFNDAQVQKSAELMKKNLPMNGGYKSNEGLRTIADNIRFFKSINNYCRVANKYKEIGGYTRIYKGAGPSLTSWLTNFVYGDNAWELHIKQPLQELINNAEANKQKSDTEYSASTTTPQTQQQGTQQQVVQPGTQQQNYQQVAGGYILSPFTTNAVNQIRTSIGITGQGGLNQTDINQLYAKIATLPNK